MTHTVNIIQSWEAIMPALIEAAANGNADAKEVLMQLARAADEHNRKVEAE